MNITRIDPENIEKIHPLWEALRAHHEEQSTHFKEVIKAFTFETRMEQLKDRDDIAVFAATKDKDIIGYCIASVKDHTGEIDSIYIDSQYRKSGIGNQLIDHAETWLKTRAVQKIQLCVAQGNESVFGFYNRHNYQHRYSVLEKTIQGL